MFNINMAPIKTRSGRTSNRAAKFGDSSSEEDDGRGSGGWTVVEKKSNNSGSEKKSGGRRGKPIAIKAKKPTSNKAKKPTSEATKVSSKGGKKKSQTKKADATVRPPPSPVQEGRTYVASVKNAKVVQKATSVDIDKDNDKPAADNNESYFGVTSNQYKHLYVFGKPGTNLDVDDDDDSDGPFGLSLDKKVATVKVGDIIVFYEQPYGFGNDDHLDWSTIVGIESCEDSDGDYYANIRLASFKAVSYYSNRVWVYRRDANGVLRDFTRGFVSMEYCLDFIDGDMARGTYFSGADRARVAMNRSQNMVNKKLVSDGVLKSMAVEDSIQLGVRQPDVVEDEVLSEVMGKVIARIAERNKEAAQLWKERQDEEDDVSLSSPQPKRGNSSNDTFVQALEKEPSQVGGDGAHNAETTGSNGDSAGANDANDTWTEKSYSFTARTCIQRGMCKTPPELLPGYKPPTSTEVAPRSDTELNSGGKSSSTSHTSTSTNPPAPCLHADLLQGDTSASTSTINDTTMLSGSKRGRDDDRLLHTHPDSDNAVQRTFTSKDPVEVADLTIQEFTIGKEYSSRSALRDAALAFGRENNFTVGFEGYNLVKCSLHRLPKHKKQKTGNDTLPDDSTREPHGNGCGCPWEIKMSRSKKTDVVTIANVSPLHNHELTTSTFDTSQRRSGKLVQAAVTSVVHVLAPLLRLKRKKPDAVQIRETLEPHLKKYISLDSKTMGSIVRSARQMIESGKVKIPDPPQLDQNAIKMFQKFSSSDISSEECGSVLDDILNEKSNDTSWIVTRLMKAIKAKDPEFFSYEFQTDNKDMVDGVIWQEGRGRAALQANGDIAFWDFRLAEGMNTLRWKYGAWITLDPNNQFVVASEGLFIAESDDMYKFLHKGTVRMGGVSPESIRLAFADEKLDPVKVKEYFPHCLLMLDPFHFLIGNKGISILSTDFGGAWSLVKDSFHNALYAPTEQECLVSSTVLYSLQCSSCDTSIVLSI